MQQRFSHRQKHLVFFFFFFFLPLSSPPSSSPVVHPPLLLYLIFHPHPYIHLLCYWFLLLFLFYLIFYILFSSFFSWPSPPPVLSSSSSSCPTSSSVKPPLALLLFYIFSLFLFLPITLIILPFHLFLPPSCFLPSWGHFSCTSSARCHTWAACLSLLKIYGSWISYFQLIYLIVCFHFFFYWCGSFDSLASFSNLCCRNTHTLQLCALVGCHRLQREEEICFHHMLMYSELRADADRYLFPRGCRESDGDCCYVFITSTLTDELSHHHIEHFCSDLVHKERQTRGLAQLKHEWW